MKGFVPLNFVFIGAVLLALVVIPTLSSPIPEGDFGDIDVVVCASVYDFHVPDKKADRPCG